MNSTASLTIGAVARRTGLSVSAIRFYESQGLIHPHRTGGGQRRFLRSDIRRLAFVIIAQRLGLPIGAIRSALRGLPDERTPTPADWRAISATVRDRIDEQIAALARMRDRLDGCIGCGCLSLDLCALYNAGDHVAARGAGPQFVFGASVKDSSRK